MGPWPDCQQEPLPKKNSWKEPFKLHLNLNGKCSINEATIFCRFGPIYWLAGVWQRPMDQSISRYLRLHFVLKKLFPSPHELDADTRKAFRLYTWHVPQPEVGPFGDTERKRCNSLPWCSLIRQKSETNWRKEALKVGQTETKNQVILL